MSGQPVGPFQALQFRFTVRCADAGLRRWIDAALGPLRAGSAATPPSEYRIEELGGRWSVSLDREVLVRAVPAARVLPTFITDVNRRAAQSSASHLVLHAAVIAQNGRPAVLLVGPSGSGKSTLVATALESGWEYGGDEHGAVRHGLGVVDPVPKPIALKHGSRQVFEPRSVQMPQLRPWFEHQLLLGPEEFGAETIGEGRPLGLVVLPRHEDAVGTSMERVHGSEALIELRRETFNWSRDHVRGFETLVAVVRRIPCFRLRFGDASSAIQSIVATEGEQSCAAW